MMADIQVDAAPHPCGQRPTTKKVPCEVYSRIVGYLRPVQNWNRGKQQEFRDRKVYQSQLGADAVEAGDKVLHSD